MTAWRGRFAPETASWIAGAAGAVTLVAVTVAAGLLLNNALGPLHPDGSGGAAAALGCGVLAGLAVFVVVRRVGRRSRLGVVALLCLASAAGWVLMPRAIDVSESFVPRPNARWSCTGWTFRHYPPGTSDASETTYCVGFEHRIADG